MNEKMLEEKQKLIDEANAIGEENMRLRELFKEQILKGDISWHGTCMRWKCVLCGETLRGSKYLFDIAKNHPEKLKEITCYDCHSRGKTLNKLFN